MEHYSTKISASILSANFLQLEKEIREIESAGIDSLHLDIMDNHLAPNISFGPPIIQSIKKITQLPMDAHLMIDAPWLFFEDYIKVGATDISFHVECYDPEIPSHETIKTHSRVAKTIDADAIYRDIQYLKSHDIRCGLTVNPNTPIDLIFPFLKQLDYVLLMSVHPGFSGQIFIPNTLDKITLLRSKFDGDIHVDGGVNKTNAKDIVKAGANVLISASYLFGSNNYSSAIRSIRIIA